MSAHVLKTDWERRQSPFSLDIPTVAKLLAPVTRDKIAQLHLCTEGLANTSYQIVFATSHPPLILRIYLRERSACQRELNLHALVKNHVTVARCFYADASCQFIPYAFAVMEWVDGMLMREVVLSGDLDSIHACAFAAGESLAKLREITFNRGGFFQEDLTITPFDEENFCLHLLKKPDLKMRLGEKLCETLVALIHENHALYPPENQVNLTHGDYDPANILVKKIDEKWQITAILDWEYALSCSYLLDMGTFLRYSHRLPESYTQAFCEGIARYKPLPPSFKKSAKLMDLGCLLSLLERNPEEKSPLLYRDVLSLLEETVTGWHRS